MQPSKKILIVGASSFIGSRMYESAQSKNLNVTGTYYTNPKSDLIKLDITNKDDLMNVVKSELPDTIVWVAGEKNVKALENDPETGMNVNTNSVTFLVDVLKSLNKQPRIVFISSDYVFDGKNGPYKTDDKTCPHTVYGVSKLKTEEFLEENWPNYAVVRTSAVMGKGSSFFNFLISSIQKDESIEFFDNLNFSPTPVQFLVETVLRISQEENPAKMYHICGDKVFSRYEFAQIALTALAGKAKLIPVSANENDSSLRADMTLSPSEKFISDFNWANFIVEEAKSDR